MSFRYMDEVGREHRLDDAVALLDAVRAHRITDTSPFYDESAGRWARASESDVFLLAKHAASPPPRPRPAIARALWERAGPDSTHKREHGILGTAYVYLLYVGAAVSVIVAVVLLAVAIVFQAEAELSIQIALFLPLIAWLQFGFARAIARFQPWTRIVALLFLWLGVILSPLQMFYAESSTELMQGVLTLAFAIPFLHYFHSRKALFRSVPLSSQERPRGQQSWSGAGGSRTQ
jgi:hypothetical protein